MKNLFKIGVLLGKYLLGRESTEELSQLKEWADSKESNRQLFEELTNRKQLSDSINTFDSFDKDAAWEQFSDTILKRTARRLYLRWGVAVSIILILSILPIIRNKQSSVEAPRIVETLIFIPPGEPKAFIEFSDGTKLDLQNMDKSEHDRLVQDVGISVDSNTIVRAEDKPVDLEPLSVVTPRGGEYKIILDDGTEVWLNADSRMEFPNKFVGTRRVVKLIGEAYFSVAKDTARPFIVNLDGVDVEVLGTEFNVSAYSNDATIQTTLVEGRVLVNNPLANIGTNKRVLTPGRQAEFDRDKQSLEIRKVNVPQYIAWKNGRFVFEYQSLREITKILGRWYDVDFTFADDRLGDMRFSGDFLRYSNIETVYDMIRKAGTKLKFNQKNGKTIEISR
ncbi:MAG: FecR family protein [Bacteroidales bacterium]